MGAMVVLALDTSSAAGSVALVRAGGDRAIVTERAGDVARSHAERLPAELMAVLEQARTPLAEVERLAVIVGPGSFTGLRIGIAAIQGLALVRRLPVAPVSTFEALAACTRRDSDTAVAAWVEAHRGEVFATLFAPDGRTVLEPPTSLVPGATLDSWRASLAALPRVRFVGDGARRYGDLILAQLGDQAAFDDSALLLAGAAGRIAAADADRAVAPHAIVPVYVRRPDVELTRDRREAASKG